MATYREYPRHGQGIMTIQARSWRMGACRRLLITLVLIRTPAWRVSILLEAVQQRVAVRYIMRVYLYFTLLAALLPTAVSSPIILRAAAGCADEINPVDCILRECELDQAVSTHLRISCASFIQHFCNHGI